MTGQLVEDVLAQHGIAADGRGWVMAEARDWLADCAWRDLDTVEEAVSDLTDADVLAMVERHCAGGLREFLRADPL